ncbi:MAG: hypothetical protein J0L84_11905 [Verrucomicrobia bacterium]|nr:hypothetical protein [Verrucomicrobiota bacterium]
MPSSKPRLRRSRNRYVDFTQLPTGSRTILFVMGFLVLAGGLMLVKMFRSTPKGFRPEVRISALDKIQAASLARGARAESEAGHLSEAVLGWQAAISNDPGDPELRRGLLKTLLGPDEPPSRYYPLGAAHAFFLLRLTETNQSDLNLASRLLSRLEQDPYVLALLQPVEDRLTPEQASSYLKALFHLQSMEQFGVAWTRYSNAVAGDRDLALYIAAWQAGWGPPATLRPALETLAAATTNAPTANTARRLTLAVATSRSDIGGFEAALTGLADARADRISDHLAHWRLLSKIGRRERAVELARAFATPPQTPGEAVALAEVQYGLGLQDAAITLLENQLPVFNFSPEIWQRLGDFLVQKERWNDLRALAIRVRTSSRVPLTQSGLTWFWEGLAEARMNRPEAAREAMGRAVEYPPAEPMIAFRMAAGMQQAGFPNDAAKLLQHLESEFGGKPAYWLQLVVAAHESRQFDVMQMAAERGYALATNNPVFINNYAACLLIQRTNAPLAIELTLRRLTASPADPGANLNHALALLQNGRLEDAGRILDRMARQELTASNRSILEFARFELEMMRGNKEAALQAYRNIDLQHLMTPQVRWLENAYERLNRPG